MLVLGNLKNTNIAAGLGGFDTMIPYTIFYLYFYSLTKGQKIAIGFIRHLKFIVALKYFRVSIFISLLLKFMLREK